jgi:hypothetical protein
MFSAIASVDLRTLIANDAYKGADFELMSISDRIKYRGPIVEILGDEKGIVIAREWVAEKIGTDWLHSQAPEEVYASIIFPPQKMADGRILFWIPNVGLGTIFPSGSNLDPRGVLGFPH